MRGFSLTALFLVAIVMTAWWWQQGRPISLVDVSDGASGIQCLSYSPFRRHGQSPLQSGSRISPAQIEQDLQLLARYTDCVRIYSVDQGLAAVPRLASQFDMQVMLGLWLGRDTPQNQTQIATAIGLAQTYPDVIHSIIVGNEVLLRREMTPSELATFIEQVNVAVEVPVTYADVWEFWLRAPEVAKAVDFITIHILPYWEDEPVAVGQALQHVAHVRETVQNTYPDHEVMIGETGWPSFGRQRAGALPGRVNQARFVREFLVWAGTKPFDFNLIEAFDQPWKRRLEGTVGGYWGLLDAEGELKFPLRGPVQEEPRWWYAPVLGLILAVGFFLLSLPLRIGSARANLLPLTLSGYVAGLVLAGRVRVVEAASITAWNWVVGITGIAAAALTAWLLTLVMAGWPAWYGEIYRPKSLIEVWHQRVTALRGINGWLGLLRFGWLFAAALCCLLLVFDARYRSFPLFLFMLPAFGFGWLKLASMLEKRTSEWPALEETLLAAWLIMAAGIIVLNEGLQNTQALLWALICLVLAATVYRTSSVSAAEN